MRFNEFNSRISGVKHIAEAGQYSGTDDTVGFSVNSEKAYTAVMSRFGNVVDHDEDSGIMYVPVRLWPQVEMVAFDADGEGATEQDGLDESGGAEGGYDKRDAYQRDYDHSVAGMGKRQSYAYQQDGGANDENSAIDDQLAAQYAQKQQYELNGDYWLKFKDSKQHVSNQVYKGKAAATAAAHDLLRQQPELKGNLLLTAYGPEGVAESAPEFDRLKQLAGLNLN